MAAAEYALIEDSNTKNLEDYTGLVTPLATPCNNLSALTSPFNKIPMLRSKSDDNTDDDCTSPNGAYPIDFQDNLRSHPPTHPRSNQGPITSLITKPTHSRAYSLDSSTTGDRDSESRFNIYLAIYLY